MSMTKILHDVACFCYLHACVHPFPSSQFSDTAVFRCAAKVPFLQIVFCLVLASLEPQTDHFLPKQCRAHMNMIKEPSNSVFGIVR